MSSLLFMHELLTCFIFHYIHIGFVQLPLKLSIKSPTCYSGFPHKNVNAVVVFTVVFTGQNDNHQGLILVQGDGRCKASSDSTILVTNVCFLCSFSLFCTIYIFPACILGGIHQSSFCTPLFIEIIRHTTTQTRFTQIASKELSILLVKNRYLFTNIMP